MSTVVTGPQPRHAAGTSAGGQYAAKATTPPGGSLAGGGSFIFPPRMSSVEETNEFFRNAPLSDRVLSNAEHAYRKWWNEQRDANRKETTEAWDRVPANQRWVERATPTEFNNKLIELINEADAKFVHTLPRLELSGDDLREILIARQVTYESSRLGTGFYEQARQIATNFRGDRVTLGAIIDYHRTHEWVHRALTETDLPAVDAMEAVATALQRQGD